MTDRSDRATSAVDKSVLRVAYTAVFTGLLATLDSTIVVVSLDDISRDLHSSLSAAQWVVTGYLLTLALSLPISGWLVDRVGVRRSFLVAVSAFAVASAACALAPSLTVLIALRVVQGLVGGLLVPMGQVIVTQVTPDDQLGRVMSLVGAPAALGPVLGPVAGGLVTTFGLVEVSNRLCKRSARESEQMTKTSKQAEQVSAFGTVEEPEDVAARRAVDAMVSAGMLDGLLAKVDAGELRLTGDGGFLPEMVKRVLEAGLAAELTDHLGYDKHDPVGRGSGNSRNGSTPKTLGTEVGDVEVATPRDRNGTFDPQLVGKGQRRLDGLSEMIISLYAKGMTVRDIQHHLQATIGSELSHETISNITEAVAGEVKAWQARPLEAVYPIVYLDALVVKVRDGHTVGNKAAHIAVGVDTDGVKHVLGIWVQTVEGRSFGWGCWPSWPTGACGTC